MGEFKLLKTTQFADLESEVLPTSDLCLTHNGAIYQFSYNSEKKVEPVIVAPGTYTITRANSKTDILPTEFRTTDLLESVSNTKSIMGEIKKFFSKLHVYDQYGIEKRRSILFYSAPGEGKSSALRKTCQDLIAEDAGTVVLIWPTSEIESSYVSEFFTVGSQYTPEVTRLILIIEDIGGGGVEEWSGPKSVDASLLAFLDGVEVSFRVPTFIVATTNFPQNLISSLADRPGRFDQLIELLPPTAEERVQLYEFFVRRPATEKEISILKGTKGKKLSIAHIKEIPIRMAIHDKDIDAVVSEMNAHTEKVKKQFSKTERMGFGD